MKDLFAFLLKSRKEFSASDKTTEDVLSSLSPLLSRLAAAKGVSEAELLGSALCDCLKKNEQMIDDNNLFKGIADEGTDKWMKSGRLDAVSDDCLKLALQYLGPTDRCRGADLTCHRLLQLSRTTPIHCRDFGEEVWNNEMDEAQTLKVARRFQTKRLDLDESKIRRGLVACFRTTLSELSIGFSAADSRECDAVFRLTFPRLKRVELHTHLFAVADFLRRNQHIEEFVVCNNLGIDTNERDWHRHGEEVFKALANCKDLRHIDLSNIPLEFKVSSGIDLTHVTKVTLNSNLCDFTTCLFHDKLQSLKLSSLFYVSLEESGKLRAFNWASLKHLDLSDDCHRLDWHLFGGVELEHCVVRGTLEDLPTAISTFKTAALEYTIECLIQMTDEERDAWLYHLGQCLHKEGLKQMTLILLDTVFDYETLATTATMTLFFRWLVSFSDRFAVTIRMSKHRWNAVSQQLTRFCVDKLQPHVEWKIVSKRSTLTCSRGSAAF